MRRSGCGHEAGANAQGEPALSRHGFHGHRWNSGANGVLLAEAGGLAAEPACQQPAPAMSRGSGQ